MALTTQQQKLVESVAHLAGYWAKKLAPKNHADDAAGYALLRLCQAAPKWNSGLSAFPTFATSTIKYAVLDWLRSSQAKKRQPRERTNPNGPEPEPAYFLQVKDREKLFREGIENLPENQKFVVRGYFFQGRTWQEIADILGISRQRAQQINVLAIRRLRKFLVDRRFSPDCF